MILTIGNHRPRFQRGHMTRAVPSPVNALRVVGKITPTDCLGKLENAFTQSRPIMRERTMAEYACKCPERQEPIKAPDGANRPGRLWRVMRRFSRQYAVGGSYKSKSSTVTCFYCGAVWRTRSLDVFLMDDIDIDDGELNIRPGCAGYAAAMERLGRDVPDRYRAPLP